jgi:hypothetical protein
MTTILETIEGAKNQHPQVRFQCECGLDRTTRATKVRRGLVTQCAACAKAAAAKRGGQKRRLPEPERSLRERWSVYKTNARVKQIEMVLSFEQAAALFTQPCSYCGSDGGGIDRLSSEHGYVVGNVAACCAICNYAKREMSCIDFLAWVERVHEHQNLLQRNRSVLLRMAEQSDGCGANPTGNDLGQVDSRSEAGRCEAV